MSVGCRVMMALASRSPSASSHVRRAWMASTRFLSTFGWFLTSFAACTALKPRPPADWGACSASHLLLRLSTLLCRRQGWREMTARARGTSWPL